MLDNGSNIDIVEAFGLIFCIFVDFPPNGTDCSKEDPTRCVKCTKRGTYLTGESIHDYNSAALWIIYAAWILGVVLSVFGVLANVLILRVLRHQKHLGSFNFLLIVLAGWDIMCCIISAVASTCFVSYFGNWYGRGGFSMLSFSLSLYTVIFAHTGSSFMTVLITIERFIVITFPLKARSWFTQRRAVYLVLFVLLIAISLNHQKFAGLCLEPNEFQDIPSLHELEYIYRPTIYGRFWYGTMKSLHNMIDYWAPLPLLLLFNFLSYLKVRQLSKRRKEMNVHTKRDMRAVEMFLPVAVVYFITHLIPIIRFMIITVTNTDYRELYMVFYISITVNSIVHLPIYYYKNSAFKKEADKIFEDFRRKLGVGDKEGMELRMDGIKRGENGNVDTLSTSESGLLDG